MTKQEGVRRALAKLGNDAKPSVIQGFVKKRFGLEMGKDHISVCKGKVLRTKAPAAPGPIAAPSTVSGRFGLDDILAVKALAARVGPHQLLKLIDALAK